MHVDYSLIPHASAGVPLGARTADHVLRIKTRLHTDAARLSKARFRIKMEFRVRERMLMEEGHPARSHGLRTCDSSPAARTYSMRSEIRHTGWMPRGANRSFFERQV